MKVTPWLRAIAGTARSGLSVERSSLTPYIAIRGACGVAVVVGLLLVFADPKLAVSSAFGAFASGVATFQRSWRPRPILALSAAGGLAASTFLGYLLVGYPEAFVLLVAVWAFGAGMAWAAGPTAGVVAALTVGVMLVAVTLPTSVLGALFHAALIALGGVVQALLIVLFPLRPWAERRDALADALAGVADYARRLRHDPVAPFDPEPLIEARNAAAVTARQARRRPRQLHGYRALAERFRPVLASLADPIVGGVPDEGPERDRVRELLSAAGTVLDATARAIRRSERVRVPAEALEMLRAPEGDEVLTGPAERAAIRLAALTDDAVEAAQEPVEVTRPALLPRVTWYTAPEGPGPPDAEGVFTPEPREGGRLEDEWRNYAAEESAELPAVGARREEHSARERHLPRTSLGGRIPVVARTIRRELRFSSQICRHALRVSGVASAGYLIGTALPPVHGYWAPLTAVMVLRPDFSRTYERGFGRFVGTLVGVGLAGTITALLNPGPYACAGLGVLFVAGMYLLMHTGYAISQGCASAYVVFLLGIAGTEWSQAVSERVLLTAFGGVLAMLSYAFFPAWETPHLRDRLADWLAATGSYACAVFDALAHPAERRPRQVRDSLLDARSARQEWEQTVARAEAEPVRDRGRISQRSATQAQSALVTWGRAVMLLEAHVPAEARSTTSGRAAEEAQGPVAKSAEVTARKPSKPSEEGAAGFTAVLRPAVEAAALAVRESEPLDWSAVHAELASWEARESHPHSVALRTAQLVVEGLDDLADAAQPRV